jgi:protocatechuate 3,4-dioxygenase alpha subunit
MNKLNESPSQTAGPYVHIGCTPNVTGITSVYSEDLGAVMKTGPVRGEEITIKGTVYDGSGAALLDAMIEIWQADADGIYRSNATVQGDPNFTGWGRTAGDLDTGEFTFKTVKPGIVEDGHAPHITFWIVARGINIGLQTRMYFDGEASNSNDPVLNQVPQERRATLLATRDSDNIYRFDIRLQGDGETVFFDI